MSQSTSPTYSQLQRELIDMHASLTVAGKAMEAEPATESNETFASISQMIQREGRHILELLQKLEDSRTN